MICHSLRQRYTVLYKIITYYSLSCVFLFCIVNNHALLWITYYTSVTTHKQKVVVSHRIRTKDHSIVWHMCLTTRPCSSVLYATCRGYIVHILGWQRYFSWALLEQQWIMQYNHVHCNTVLSNKKYSIIPNVGGIMYVLLSITHYTSVTTHQQKVVVSTKSCGFSLYSNQGP
jgi:hypothetical protein